MTRLHFDRIAGTAKEGSAMLVLREGLARMLKSLVKFRRLQLQLQAHAGWVGALVVVRNQFGRAMLVIALVVSAAAQADVAVTGEDASGYQAAAHLWLDGSDDLVALRQLSSPASDGNTAEQVFLIE